MAVIVDTRDKSGPDLLFAIAGGGKLVQFG